jgi:hypothetical protein
VERTRSTLELGVNVCCLHSPEDPPDKVLVPSYRALLVEYSKYGTAVTVQSEKCFTKEDVNSFLDSTISERNWTMEPVWTGGRLASSCTR